MSKRKLGREFIPVISIPNSVYNKEVCVLCNKYFDTSDSLYQILDYGYICYDCMERLKIPYKGCDLNVENQSRGKYKKHKGVNN